MKILISCDNNYGYRDYWPFVRDTWLHWGYDPILIHVTNTRYFHEDRVIELPVVIKSDPNHLQGRIARLYGCTLFPDDVCITADIDLFVLNKDYIRKTWDAYNSQGFLCYSWGVYKNPTIRCPISYIGAMGSVWKSLQGECDWPQFLFNFGNEHGTATDEMILSQWMFESTEGMTCLQRKMSKFDGKHRAILDRIRKHDGMKFSTDVLKKGGYIDVTCQVPYHKHKEVVQKIWELAISEK